jgi:hypothetical protein
MKDPFQVFIAKISANVRETDKKSQMWGALERSQLPGPTFEINCGTKRLEPSITK